ncbi:MAG: hypothetical protein RL684_706, partial [Pseudomonadota bacterium]
DLGTPAPGAGAAAVRISIDGRELEAPAGTSILRAAALAGIDIPKLCATDTLRAFGSCRLCLVEVEGRKGHPASCTTLVAEGMKVRTQGDTLARLRRNVLELYVSEHPLACNTCTADGHCELQAQAARHGVTGSRYGNPQPRAGLQVDRSNPYFSFDSAQCIACSRCVRACDEVQGTFALTMAGRGLHVQVAASAGEAFLDSECVSCGACVEACPTEALIERSRTSLPERSVHTTCAYCGVGCGLVAEARGEQVLRMVPDRAAAANHGHACVKGRFAYGYAVHRDRVRMPLLRERIDEPWREVSWEVAFAEAARRLRDIQARHGTDSIGGITSSRCTNEETYLVQKLVRAAFHNNNVDTCARVCHSPTGYGLKQTLGESAGTQAFDSVQHADVVLLIGANPAEAHPVFASQLKQRLRQGARLIVVDPRATALVRTPHVAADVHLALRPGTNVAIANALAHVIVTEGLVQESYVRERCEPAAFARWRAFVAEPRNSPEASAAVTGVDARLVREAARLYARGPNSAIYYGLGVTEHSQGTTMVMAIANLAMATGNLGREGVGEPAARPEQRAGLV